MNIAKAKITVYQQRKRWMARIDNEVYDTPKLSKLTGIAVNNLSTAFREQKFNPDKASEWLRNMIWLNKHGHKKSATIYKRDGKWLTVSDVVAKGVNRNTAYAKLAKWANGQITEEELFKKGMTSKEKGAAGMKRKEELRNAPIHKELKALSRRRKIHEIPSPTPIERQLYGY